MPTEEWSKETKQTNKNDKKKGKRVRGKKTEKKSNVEIDIKK